MAENGARATCPTAVYARPVARPGGRRTSAYAAVSAALTIGVIVTGLLWRRAVPFGDRGRGINDLAAQYVPFHAHLWDLLHGETPGGWMWNWQSGLGVAFLPDLATYLGNPLALSVALWPRDQIESAVLVVTLATLALAASAMTVYLLRVRPDGPPGVAAFLGCAYATCGWALNDGSYVPMWLTGLVGLPLLAIVGEWAIERTHAVAAPMVVALVWFANYYTGFMATLGAGLLILVRVVGEQTSVRSAVTTLLLVARHFALGIGISMVSFIPALRAARSAQPTPDNELVSIPWTDILGRLLPMTEGVGLTPGLYVGTATLVAALTLVFNTRVEARLRVTALVSAAALVLSVNWAPTQAMWHGFDIPNGNPFREAFVVCGFLVMLAWISVSAEPGWRAVTGGAAGAVIIVLFGSNGLGVTSESIWWALALTLLSTAWLLSRNSRHRNTRAAAILTAVLATAVLAESTVTWVATDARRETRLGGARTPWGPDDSVSLAVGREATSQGVRLGPTGRKVPNAPLLYGSMGIGYYSSTMAETTSRALRTLGVPWSAGGRATSPRADPGLDPLVGVSSLEGDAAGTGESDWARILPVDTPPSAADPWQARDALAGATIYDEPVVTVSVGGLTRPIEQPGLVVEPPRGDRMTLTATCPTGTTVQFWAPSQAGAIRVGHEVITLTGPGARPGRRVSSGVHTLAESRGEPIEVVFLSTTRLTLPAAPVACLNTTRLHGLAESWDRGRLTLGASSFHIEWDGPRTGLAMMPTAVANGWTCHSGERQLRVTSAVGMVGLPLREDSSVRCSYRTPGLRLGGALTLASAAIALALGLRQRRRGLSLPPSPSRGDHHPTT